VGVLVAVSAKLSMLPLALVCLWPLRGAPPRSWLAPLTLLALALAGHALYNQARFGTPFETGYCAQATPSAFRTPLLVGLYGLLLSSGKGIAWFAPALWLAPSGWRAMRRAGGSHARAAAGIALVAAIALLLYARFEHWAGDGSFGPRYLVPILPLAFVPVAFALEEAAGLRKTLATALAIAGLAVQLGGVAIYFGAQMREAGDYPYRLPLDDPHFMSESHFNPHHSPIAGHWRMLARNAGEHARLQIPSVSTAGEVDPRVGVSAQDQQQLLHALDFWWLYAIYAGVSLVPVFAVFVALMFATGWCTLQMLAAAADEGRAR
jgi:hypothetical protein